MAEDPHILEVGGSFGDYRVLKLLGAGAMGAVYLLELPSSHQLCAAKILNPEVVKKSRSFRKRFVREAEIAMKIDHPNLVGVYDVGEDPDSGLCYILMEYVSGGTLRERLAREGQFPVPAAVRIVRDIASVLMVAEQNSIVHRDIKPDNIMFADDGTPKLADLGIARLSEEEGGSTTVTMNGQMIGTPAYMAPEQMQDAHAVDTRADIYSLGIVFYEMLTGKRPNEGEPMMQILAKAMRGDPIPDVRTIRPGISGAVAQLVNIMCMMQVEKRIASAEEVVDLADRLADREEEGPTPEERLATDPPPPPSPTPIPVVSETPTKRALRSLGYYAERDQRYRRLLLVLCALIPFALFCVYRAFNPPPRSSSRRGSRSPDYAAAGYTAAGYAAKAADLRHCEMNGLTWTYRLRGGRAIIENMGNTAVSPLPDGAVAVPGALDDYPVEQIGQRALSGCPGITSVLVPEGVTLIGPGAFEGDAALDTLMLPNSLEEIGEMALAGTAIENLNLRRVSRLPERLGGMSRLAEIQVSPDNPAFCVNNGILYDRGHETLYLASRRIASAKLPLVLRWIAAGAFSGGAIESVEIPESVVHVGPEAFRGCAALKRVVMKGRRTAVQDRAFADCVELEIFDAPLARLDGGQIFANCPKLKARDEAGGAAPAEGE